MSYDYDDDDGFTDRLFIITTPSDLFAVVTERDDDGVVLHVERVMAVAIPRRSDAIGYDTAYWVETGGWLRSAPTTPGEYIDALGRSDEIDEVADRLEAEHLRHRPVDRYRSQLTGR